MTHVAGLSFGGRVFARRPLHGRGAVLCALFVRLGAWQWQGMQRQEQWTRFARGADKVIALGSRAVSDVPLYPARERDGSVGGARQFLLENRAYRTRRLRSADALDARRRRGAAHRPLGAVLGQSGALAGHRFEAAAR